MANIGDKIKYFHGKDDNRFHEGIDSHDAEICEVGENNTVSLVILNDEGVGTIPVKNVPHKKDKKRNKDAAYWSEQQ